MLTQDLMVKIPYSRQLSGAKGVVRQLIRDEGAPNKESEVNALVTSTIICMLGRPGRDTELASRLRRDLAEYINGGQAQKDIEADDESEDEAD